jgi:hypothetical protein
VVATSPGGNQGAHQVKLFGRAVLVEEDQMIQGRGRRELQADVVRGRNAAVVAQQNELCIGFRGNPACAGSIPNSADCACASVA